MPEVLPNLEDLLAALPADEAGADAAALARAAAAAASWPQATKDLAGLVQTWIAP